MEIPIIDRPPTALEVEKLRLILSTYQDGTGMLPDKKVQGRTKPGWRDFERSIAQVFNGKALESKHVFDVLLDAEEKGLYYGVSCKMRQTLSKVDQHGVVTIEFSNADGEFWRTLASKGINQQNISHYEKETGSTLVKLVEHWHKVIDIENGGNIYSNRSVFFILQYNSRSWVYQLFRFPLHLNDPNLMDWTLSGKHLLGKLNGAVLWEWYGFSGGQLKYYPNIREATWVSEKFTLEPLPTDREVGVINKVKDYFPEAWSRVQQAENNIIP